MTMWHHYAQNNSGGSFEIDPEAGIGPHVWIEAEGPDEANKRAIELGIYFDGVEVGVDCECCGDRWYENDGWEAKAYPHIEPEYHFSWHPVVYLHSSDGNIHHVTKADVLKEGVA